MGGRLVEGRPWWGRRGIGNRRHRGAQERQAFGRCCCAICFGAGEERELPGTGLTDARARRSARDGGVAPFSSRELDERSCLFEADRRSNRISSGTDEAG